MNGRRYFFSLLILFSLVSASCHSGEKKNPGTPYVLFKSDKNKDWQSVGPTPEKFGVFRDYGFTGVWGASSEDVYVVGGGEDAGFIYRTTDHGKDWNPEKMDIPTAARPLNAIWGRHASDIYAVGDKGEILHKTGDAWVRQESHTEENLQAVWGDSHQTVYAVGNYIALLTHDGGKTWIPQKFQDAVFCGVWGTSSGETFLVGTSYPEKKRRGLFLNSSGLSPGHWRKNWT